MWSYLKYNYTSLLVGGSHGKCSHFDQNVFLALLVSTTCSQACVYKQTYSTSQLKKELQGKLCCTVKLNLHFPTRPDKPEPLLLRSIDWRWLDIEKTALASDWITSACDEDICDLPADDFKQSVQLSWWIMERHSQGGSCCLMKQCLAQLTRESSSSHMNVIKPIRRYSLIEEYLHHCLWKLQQHNWASLEVWSLNLSVTLEWSCCCVTFMFAHACLLSFWSFIQTKKIKSYRGSNMFPLNLSLEYAT